MRKRHEGFTLIELVMVISAAALVMSMTAILLSSMMRQQSASTKQLAYANSLTRMTGMFRTDVASAAEANLSDGGATLAGPNGRELTWAHEGEFIVRTLVQGASTRQEFFEVPPHHTVRFQSRELAPNVTMVGLTVGPELSTGMEPKASFDPRHVVASRGAAVWAELRRDQRWSRGND